MNMVPVPASFSACAAFLAGSQMRKWRGFRINTLPQDVVRRL